MTPLDALGIVQQVGANYVGKLADHQKIQEALEVLKKLVDSKQGKQPPPKPHGTPDT